MYSDSDDEYDESTGRYRYADLRAQPPLLLLQDQERDAKNTVHRGVEKKAMVTTDDERSGAEATEKQRMRAYYQELDKYSSLDWHRPKVLRFFQEMQGFHTGNLDLSGRAPWRYQQLCERWSAFYSAFVHFVKSADGFAIDDNEWADFRSRWKITKDLYCEDVIRLTLTTNEIIRAQSTPLYQSLYIQDLPPEILGDVFDLADFRDARSLSATSRYMRQASLTYIFHNRRILLALPTTSSLLEDRPLAEEEALLSQALSNALDEIEFLQSRPDIIKRLRYLHIENQWITPQLPDGGRASNATQPRSGMLLRFRSKLCELLARTELQSLYMFNVDVDVDISEHLASQDRLSKICLQYCFATEALRTRLDLTPPLATTICSLHLKFELEYTWDALALCPALRQLFVEKLDAYNGFSAPRRSLWPQLHALNSVELLHLQGVDPWPRVFADWFLYASSLGPFRMTHFKITACYGLGDTDIAQLLRALHAGSPPLRVLVLDGMATGSPALFDTIGQLFPLLCGLTVLRRESSRQVESKLSCWPSPMHEYASHIRALTSLRHFGVNFDIIYDNVSPADFDRVPEPDPEPSYSPCGPRFVTWDDLRPPPPYYGMWDASTVALPFAAYCPSLETFLITAWCPRFACRIRRSDTGALKVEEHWPRIPPKQRVEGSEDYAVWNPLPGDTWVLPPT